MPLAGAATGISIFGQIRQGSLRLIGLGDPLAQTFFPDVPLIARDVPGFETYAWFGLCAPRGLPESVVGRWEAAVRQAVDEPKVREKLMENGLVPRFAGSAALNALMQENRATFRSVIQEKTNLVRRSARMLTALANATIPLLTVVLRKAYGLGYYIMGSRPLHPSILLAWPTAEFGGMGLEGAASIIHRQELAAVEDPAERAALHRRRTEELRAYNTALEVAGRFAYDDVIDPAETRGILARVLRGLPAPPARNGRKRLIEPC